MYIVEWFYCIYLYVWFGNNGKGIWDLKYFFFYVLVLDVGDIIVVLFLLKGIILIFC